MWYIFLDLIQKQSNPVWRRENVKSLSRGISLQEHSRFNNIQIHVSSSTIFRFQCMKHHWKSSHSICPFTICKKLRNYLCRQLPLFTRERVTYVCVLVCPTPQPLLTIAPALSLLLLPPLPLTADLSECRLCSCCSSTSALRCSMCTR